MSHARHARPTLGDLLFEMFYAGAIGGVVVAVFFLGLDSLGGHPLSTPAALGHALLGLGGNESQGADLTAVALVTVLHFSGFALLGAVAAHLVRLVERRTEGSFIFSFLAMIVLLDAVALVAGTFLFNDDPGVPGMGPVLLANVLASAAMTAFLRTAHCSGEAENALPAGSALRDSSGTAQPV